MIHADAGHLTKDQRIDCATAAGPLSTMFVTPFSSARNWATVNGTLVPGDRLPP